jgi:methyl-accepting chemotaxis protein
MPNIKRRQIMVNKKLQIGVSATIVMWIFTYLIVFSMIVVVAPVLLRMTSGGRLPTVPEVYDEFWGIFSRLAVPLLLTLAILGAHATVFLHRIAGPAYRFKMWLRGVREGDLATGVYLRKTDMFKDVAKEMNETLDVLRQDIARAQAGDVTALEKYRTDASVQAPELLVEDEKPVEV